MIQTSESRRPHQASWPYVWAFERTATLRALSSPSLNQHAAGLVLHIIALSNLYSTFRTDSLMQDSGPVSLT